MIYRRRFSADSVDGARSFSVRESTGKSWKERVFLVEKNWKIESECGRASGEKKIRRRAEPKSGKEKKLESTRTRSRM